MMVKLRAVLFSAIVVFGLGMNYRASAQVSSPAATPAETKPEGVGSATVVTVHAKIIKVNKSRKLVTLEGPEGRKVTLTVQNPYNLQAAKVGEPVIVRYYEVVTIRKKRPNETVPGASLKEGIATAQPGEVPGAVIGRKLSLLVSVDAIDEANGTVTVKGPDGTTETVKARDPRNLKRLKVGDDLVVSISRAVAISLEKETGSGTS
jgi:hypothetical protein